MKRHIFDVDCKKRLTGPHGHGPTRTAQRLFKRYAGQRLYRPATSTYLTRGDLINDGEKNGEKFVVNRRPIPTTTSHSWVSTPSSLSTEAHGQTRRAESSLKSNATIGRL